MVDSYELYIDKLEGDFKETFRQIDMYVTTNNFDRQSQEEIMSSLLDTFLAAQEDGRPVEKITGKNIEQFCKTICSGYGFKEYMISFFERVAWEIILIFVIATLEMVIILNDYFLGGQISIWSYRSDYNIACGAIYLVAFVFLNNVMDFVVKKIMFRCKKVFIRWIYVFRCLFAIAICIIGVWAFFYNPSILNLPVWICFVISGLITVLYVIITKERRRKKRENKISFWEYCNVESDMQYSLSKEMIKRYFKKNQKRVKKGKKPYTQEEFLVCIERENKRWYNTPHFYFLLPIVIMIPVLIWMSVTNQFETILDIMLFGGIMFFVEYLIMGFFWKATKYAIKKRTEWIEKELESPTSWEEENM